MTLETAVSTVVNNQEESTSFRWWVSMLFNVVSVS